VATIPEAPVPATVTAPDPVVSVDPLAWITNRTPAVFIVSSTSRFFLRHENPRANPPVPSLSIESVSDPQPWYANPFDFRNEDRVMEQNNKVMLSKWHHIRIHRENALLYWGDERAIQPDETVISPEKFKGWNKLMRAPNGEMDPITEFVPLRELTRFLLQKNGMTFLNWDYHKELFDPRAPNPYHRKLPGVGSVMKRELAAMAGKTIDSSKVR